MHDDLFDFIYTAMPGYEENGRRRVLLGCWGAFQDPDVCNFEYRDMAGWGRAMFVTPGVVVDGKLVTNSLVDINLGIRILLGSSYYDDWEGQEMFVTNDPLGNPVDRRHPWNQHTNPHPQKRDFSDKYSWVMSPRWFDGTDHLALDTGGGPIARLWSTALSGLVDTNNLKATGNSVEIHLPKTALKPEVTFEWKIPQWSNTIERNRARTYFQAYAAAAALHFAEKSLEEIRAGHTKTWAEFKVPDESIGCGFTEAVRGVLSHHLVIKGGKIAELPPVSPDAVERESHRQLRNARTVRGRGHEHADLRGELPRQLQGHRHHAGGTQLRPVPPVRRAHVSRQGQGVAQGALPHGIPHHRQLTSNPGRREERMEPIDLRATGDRIEQMLDQLESSLDGRSWEQVQDVVSLVTELYGGGLARILELAGEDDALLHKMADDDLVASLLVLHDLHPLGLAERVHGAIESVQALSRVARRRRRGDLHRRRTRAWSRCACWEAVMGARRRRSRSSSRSNGRSRRLPRRSPRSRSKAGHLPPASPRTDGCP